MKKKFKYMVALLSPPPHHTQPHIPITNLQQHSLNALVLLKIITFLCLSSFPLNVLTFAALKTKIEWVLLDMKYKYHETLLTKVIPNSESHSPWLLYKNHANSRV